MESNTKTHHHSQEVQWFQLQATPSSHKTSQCTCSNHSHMQPWSLQDYFRVQLDKSERWTRVQMNEYVVEKQVIWMRTPLTTSGIAAKAACWAMCCCIAIRVCSSIWGGCIWAIMLWTHHLFSRICRRTIVKMTILTIVSDCERNILDILVNVLIRRPYCHSLLRHG